MKVVKWERIISNFGEHEMETLIMITKGLNVE